MTPSLTDRIEQRIRGIPAGRHIYTSWTVQALGQHLGPDVIRAIATAAADEASRSDDQPSG